GILGSVSLKGPFNSPNSIIQRIFHEEFRDWDGSRGFNSPNSTIQWKFHEEFWDQGPYRDLLNSAIQRKFLAEFRDHPPRFLNRSDRNSSGSLSLSVPFPIFPRTPFHADVFRSYSWSANVCGRKRWLLYPPGEERFLTDTHGNLPFDLTAPEFRDPRIYPRSGLARAPLEIIQEAGEIVFVPSGWHHQVHNLEDTISINHNWLNGCSVGRMWRFLREELGAVSRELSRWHGPDGHDPLQCQVRNYPGIPGILGILPAGIFPLSNEGVEFCVFVLFWFLFWFLLLFFFCFGGRRSR
uniref:Jumonji domain-containing protein 4 n=1 Tax=Cyanistes caeruleus TaxID=156563 RepID=A0A8C0UIC4_CYACU